VFVRAICFQHLKAENNFPTLQLPQSVLAHVFSYLEESPRYLFYLCLVCKQWKQLVAPHLEMYLPTCPNAKRFQDKYSLGEIFCRTPNWTICQTFGKVMLEDYWRNILTRFL
jgi:hypothetical protein